MSRPVEISFTAIASEGLAERAGRIAILVPENGRLPSGLPRAAREAAARWPDLRIALTSGYVGEDVDAVLEALSRGLTQKMLHGTLAELRAGDAEMRAQTAQTVSRLFLRSQSKTGR